MVKLVIAVVVRAEKEDITLLASQLKAKLEGPTLQHENIKAIAVRSVMVDAGK